MPYSSRHPDHRRGPRALPEHRLPPGLRAHPSVPPSRPADRRHLGHHRHGEVLPRLRRRARRPGLGPRLPGGGTALAAGGAAGGGGGRASPTPTGPWPPARSCWPESTRGDVLVFMPSERDIRETRDLLSSRLRERRRGTSGVEVLPLFSRLSAAEQHRVFGLPRGPPHRHRHQHRRDLPDHPGNPLRRRHRPGPHLALQPPHPDPAAADRGDQPLLGRAAQGALRPRRGRDLRAPLRRGGAAGAAGAHAAGDPARQPRRGDPADARPGAGTGGELPLPRPTLRGGGPRRLPAAGGARGDRRRTAGSPPWGGTWPACRSRRRCRAWSCRPADEGALEEVLVIAAAISVQDPRERPAEEEEKADLAHRRFVPPAVRLPHPAQHLERLPRPHGGGHAVAAAQVLQAALPLLPAHARVAGHPRPAARHPAGSWAASSWRRRPPAARPRTTPCTAACSPGS